MNTLKVGDFVIIRNDAPIYYIFNNKKVFFKNQIGIIKAAYYRKDVYSTQYCNYNIYFIDSTYRNKNMPDNSNNFWHIDVFHIDIKKSITLNNTKNKTQLNKIIDLISI